MSDPSSVAQFTQDQASGLYLPTQTRTNLIPFDDLQILNPPTGWGNLNTDAITALAILTAQGPTTPRLLSTDSIGQLRVASRNGWVARTVTDMPIGSQSVRVDVGAPVVKSDVCQITFGAPGSQTTLGIFIVDDVQPDGTLHFEENASVDIPIGSTVSQLPQVALSSFSNKVVLSPGNIVQILGAVASGQGGATEYADNSNNRAVMVRDAGLPLSATAAQAFNNPSTPLLSFAAQPGFAFVVHSYSVTLATFGASTAQTYSITVQDTSSGGTTRWVDGVAVGAAANLQSTAKMTDARIGCAKGAGCSIFLNGPLPVNMFCAMSFGVYLE